MNIPVGTPVQFVLDGKPYAALVGGGTGEKLNLYVMASNTLGTATILEKSVPPVSAENQQRGWQPIPPMPVIAPETPGE